jgi:Flp pilus assembly secretin CpaC
MLHAHARNAQRSHSKIAPKTPWEITSGVHIAKPLQSLSEVAASAAVTHNSGDVFALGNTLSEIIGWRYVYHAFKKQLEPTTELHHMFALHSRYIQQNMKRQKELITDVKVASRSFIISEISVIESQKQTIERLLGAYTTAVFAQQTELANFKANAVALLGVGVAIAAFVITDLRFQRLLE